MNGNTGANRGLRRAGTLAVIATIAVLATACGVHFSFSGGPRLDTFGDFPRGTCLRALHPNPGVPNFPTPTNASERFHVSGLRHGKITSPRARANDACQHLLPRGSVTMSKDK